MKYPCKNWQLSQHIGNIYLNHCLKPRNYLFIFTLEIILWKTNKIILFYKIHSFMQTQFKTKIYVLETDNERNILIPFLGIMYFKKKLFIKVFILILRYKIAQSIMDTNNVPKYYWRNRYTHTSYTWQRDLT